MLSLFIKCDLYLFSSSIYRSTELNWLTQVQIHSTPRIITNIFHLYFSKFYNINSGCLLFTFFFLCLFFSRLCKIPIHSNDPRINKKKTNEQKKISPISQCWLKIYVLEYWYVCVCNIVDIRWWWWWIKQNKTKFNTQVIYRAFAK